MCLRGACSLTSGAEEILDQWLGKNQDVNIKSNLMTPYYMLSRTMLIALS